MSQPSSRALHDHASLFGLLRAWCECGWLRELDYALARLFAEIDPQASPLLLLGAALVSHQLGHGHVCLDLQAALAEPDFTLSLPPEGDASGPSIVSPAQALEGVTLQAWRDACRGSALSADGQGGSTPLVLDGGFLYLRRYWDYERQAASHIAERLRSAQDVPADLAERLARLFPEPLVLEGRRRTDWQKLACAMAARGRFTIVTGGPGTGKTTTVVRLLALLQEAALDAGRPLRLSMAAPTGKAAARLTESIRAQIAALAVDEAVRARIPSDVSTVHRLLGSRPDTRTFRHHAGNPLPLDVLVVDEASMIDLEMMARLLDALPPHARLVLLGDKDQLASVEAGSVLGDLCRGAEEGGYSPATRAWLEAQTGETLDDPALRAADRALAQHIVMLRHSRRFEGGSGISRLAQAVNAGRADEARMILAEDRADLHGVQVRGAQDPALDNLLLEGLPGDDDAPVGYARYLRWMRDHRPAPDGGEAAWESWVVGVLRAFDRFRLLCAVRKGPWGVEELNRRVVASLQREGLLEPGRRDWYEGRPVLVTRNDYSLGLMNGDIGIALSLPVSEAESGDVAQRALRVVFPRDDGRPRYISPSRLGEVETVFAMTVHKSQGSEFEHCALVLPDTPNPVLTRELVYTGVTRARKCFSLLESRAGIFDQAVGRRVERRSGLRELLNA